MLIKKYLLIPACCFLLFNPLSSQMFELADLRFESVDPGNPVMFRVVGQIGDYLYTQHAVELKKLGTFGHVYEIYLDKYDAQRNLVKQAVLGLNDKPGEQEKERIFAINNQIILFASTVDKDKKIKTLSWETIDPETLIPSGNKNPLITSDFSDFNWINSGNYMFDLSDDGSKLLILRNKPYKLLKKGIKEAFEIYLYDKQLSLLHSSDETLNMPDALFNLFDITVSNSGNCAVIGTHRSNYYFITYTNPGYNAQMDSLRFDFRGKLNEGLQYMHNDNYFLAAGFFSDTTRAVRTGCFLFKYDLWQHTMVTESFSYFSKESDKEVFASASKIPQVKNLRLWNIALDDKDNCYITGDYKGSKSIDIYQADGYYNKTFIGNITYGYYGDIELIKLNPQGEIAWYSTIPRQKKIVDSNKHPFEFAVQYVFTYKDWVGILYNEKPGNLKAASLSMEKENWKEAVVALAIVNTDGTSKRIPLTDKPGFVARTSLSQIIDKQKLIISVAPCNDYRNMSQKVFDLAEIFGKN